MAGKRYVAIGARSRDEIDAELACEDPGIIAVALIAAALHDPGRAWVEDLVASFLGHDHPDVRGAAAIAAGHLARLHGALDTARLMPGIERLLSDPRTSGKASSALEDIATFVAAR